MYAKLLNNLETLKLEKMYSYVSTYLDKGWYKRFRSACTPYG